MFVGIVSKPKTEIQGSKLHMLAHVSELIIWHKVENQSPWKEKSLCFYICTKKSCLYIYIYINILASSCFRSMGFYGGWSVKPQLGIANVTLGFPEMFSSFNIYVALIWSRSILWYIEFIFTQNKIFPHSGLPWLDPGFGPAISTSLSHGNARNNWNERQRRRARRWWKSLGTNRRVRNQWLELSCSNINIISSAWNWYLFLHFGLWY